MFFFIISGFLITQEVPSTIQEKSKAVVNVISYNQKNKEIRRGKGVIISEDGLVLTNYHLLQNSKSIKVEMIERKELKRVNWKNVLYLPEAKKGKKKRVKAKKYKVEGFVGFDREFDLIILKLKTSDRLPFVPLTKEKIGVGDKVLFVVDENTVSEGAITNILELSNERKVLQSNLPVYDELSGNPVINTKGEVVGIATFIVEKANLIVPIDYINGLLKNKKTENINKISKEDYFNSGEYFYLRGLSYILLEKFQEAIQAFENSININRQNSDAFFQLGFLYGKTGDNEKALQAYKEACSINPNNYRAFFGIGKIYLKQNQYNQAIPPFTECTRIKPDFPDAYYNLGLCYEEIGQLATAAEIYKKFIEINPGPAWTAYSKLGEVYIKLQQYDKAVTAFEEVIKSTPNDIRANYNLAYAYDMCGETEKAVDIYRKLINLTPDQAETYYNRIFRVYDKKGDFNKALEVGMELVNRYPDKAIYYYYVGIEHFKLGNNDKAIEFFNKTIELDPNYAPAYYNSGLVYFRLKRFDRAAEVFEKFLELQPDNADACYNLGSAYLQIKQYEKALKPLQKAVKLRPNFALAHYNLAITYYLLKDQLSANEEYKILLNLDPNLAAKLKKVIFK
ncbi:tetratricopeptide repeat protein [Candidatus Aminicenantes bacterium AC-335-O07]|nr:tetratricopeptide repeat protein [Candidatus Aminicenantes bacterium AC-335-O07]